MVVAGPVWSREPLVDLTNNSNCQTLGNAVSRGHPALIAPRMQSAIPVTGTVNLLDELEYTALERDQGSCNNSWLWAGTGVMEIALKTQTGIKDRLSEQFLNSCGMGSFACCGGWLTNLVDFYAPANDPKRDAIPWANSGAEWQDGSLSCDNGESAQACALIDTSQKYVVSSIARVRIATAGVTSDQAIANIKTVLDQRKGVWFAVSFPNQEDWSSLQRFWTDEDESATWRPDLCDHRDDGLKDATHMLLCVGYDDTDPGNRYWLMLNSWGVTPERPNGLLRVGMDLPYDCSYVGEDGVTYTYYWETLDVTFDVGDQSVANDDFGEALVIPGVPYQHSQSTAGASIAPTDPSIDCADPVSKGGRSVWFRYTPDFTGQLNVNTCGSSYDTVLALWTGTEGALQLVACDNDSSGGAQSALAVVVSAGATYYVEVVDRDISRQSGELKLAVSREAGWQNCLPLILKGN